MRIDSTDEMIKAFVLKLAQTTTVKNLHNMYSGEEGKPLCDNLIKYLTEMAKHKPTHLMLGEAAGPNGARITGIPFTDEETLQKGPITIGTQQIYAKQYNTPNFDKVKTASSEQSAKRVWSMIQSAQVLPLMWNAVPFYPHKAKDKIRTPRVTEVREYSIFIKELLYIFPTIKYHGATGRVAQIALVEALGWPPYIDHPSRLANNFTQKALNFLQLDGSNSITY